MLSLLTIVVATVDVIICTVGVQLTDTYL